MRKKRKGFTLVELLVVIAIIALLMGILMPALARVRAIAFRVVCGTNLSGLGKAMLIYANDNEDEFPRAGYRGSGWGSSLAAWAAPNRADAYSGRVTVSSSLYLLVKYVDVGPKQFVCKGTGTGTTEFKLADYGITNLYLEDVWDFGTIDPDHPLGSELYCSYSYHAAIGNNSYALNVASSPAGMAVAADRNPWLDRAADPAYRNTFLWNGTDEQQKAGNAIAHGGEGQNVLFLGSHVTYEKRSFCGAQEDNIYTMCTNRDEPQQGVPPNDAAAVPQHREDSLLVNESGATQPR